MIRLRIAGRARARWMSGLVALTLGGLAEVAVFAENIVRWTTNYYTVGGATARDIRRSMNAARPWKNREGVDASTAWRVEWKFEFDSSSGGCRITDVSTVTTITTTLPRYIPATNAASDVVQRWVKYFGALARHEAQHAEIAKAAGLEIQAALSNRSASSCPTLRQEVEAAANAILERRRREERAMDLRTQHGATEGARFP